MEQLGFISIQNEDGTQWLSDEAGTFGSCKFRRPFYRSKFEELEARAEWNLTWHPCTVEEADEANRIAYEAEQEHRED